MRKIYEIIIKPNEQACFYVREGLLTRVNDEEYPFNHEASHYWEPENTYTSINRDRPMRVVTPLARLLKKNFRAYAKMNVEFLVAYKDLPDSNIIVARRNLNEEEMECGFFLYDAITHNELTENLMQVFW